MASSKSSDKSSNKSSSKPTATVFEETSATPDTIYLNLTDSNDEDVVDNYLRVIFVPSTTIFLDQLKNFRSGLRTDELSGSKEAVVLEFTSSMYGHSYPFGYFTARYGVTSNSNDHGIFADNRNFRLLNIVEGHIEVAQELLTPLADGDYLLTQYNSEISDDSPICYVRMFFKRGLPVGVSVIVDLINNWLTVSNYNGSGGAGRGNQQSQTVYSFNSNTTVDTMLALASAVPNPQVAEQLSRYNDYRLL